MIMDSVDMGAMVIYINLSTLIICKNSPSIMNTRFNTKSSLYFM